MSEADFFAVIDAAGGNSRIVDARLHCVGISARANWLFLELSADDGRQGWGELTLRAHEGVIAEVVRGLLPSLRGNTPGQLRYLRRAFPGLPSGRAGNAVLSALDQACMDLAGQYRNVPIHAMWQRGAAPLRAYATVHRSVAQRTPEGFAAACAAAVEAGFRGVKIMPLDAVTPQTAASAAGRSEIDSAVARLAAVREAVGKDVALMADCHWRLDEDSARYFIDAVRGLDLYWLECPVPESGIWHRAIRNLRARANGAGVRLAGAENIIGAAGALPFTQGGLYDVIMPDIKYCGGYAEFLRIAQDAEKFGVEVSPHNPSGPIAHAHTVQICTALALPQAVEQQFAESTLFKECVRGSLPIFRNGSFESSGLPGLGVALAQEVARAHPGRESGLSMADPSFA